MLNLEVTGVNSCLYQTEGISLQSQDLISHECHSEDRCCFRFYIKKKKCYEVFCLFVCFSPHMEWKQIFKSSTFFFPLNLNSHFPTSSKITWSIWYFSANLTHVINRVSSYKMNNLYEGSESQNTASFLHEYFCASHLSHTSLLIWFLSDWELRPRVVAPIGASALPFFFFQSLQEVKIWHCYAESVLLSSSYLPCPSVCSQVRKMETFLHSSWVCSWVG